MKEVEDMSQYPDSNREVVCHILNLFPTINEALQHLPIQLGELRLEESGVLFRDIAVAIGQIVIVLPQLVPQESESYLLNLTVNIRQAISQVADAYETGDLMVIRAVVVNDFIPTVENWQHGLEEVLRSWFSS